MNATPRKQFHRLLDRWRDAIKFSTHPFLVESVATVWSSDLAEYFA